ncbi:hypothetical protein IQ07DRAFT_24706 [Pyrenochaeta sp. DS3sAY3a]|nr:hypothetical protein IQ07DRAFT_24706 [Pyrenochaeta sp. DS3sAY3a]
MLAASNSLKRCTLAGERARKHAASQRLPRTLIRPPARCSPILLHTRSSVLPPSSTCMSSSAAIVACSLTTDHGDISSCLAIELQLCGVLSLSC